jgi:hypothetical protein
LVTLSAPAFDWTCSPVIVLMVKLFPVPVDPTQRTQHLKTIFCYFIYLLKALLVVIDVDQ